MNKITKKITKINLDDVLTNKDKYNVNNLLPSEDYEKVISWSNTKNWIFQFHDHDSIQVIKVTDINDLKWMYDASKIGYISRRFSALYKEELEDFCDRYAAEMNAKLMIKGVFVRTEHVSLKTGMHGTGPYYSIKQIIESICTSSHGHAALRKTDKELNIYLIPWLNMDTEKEFRVFVFDNRITGISVQQLYRRNKWLEEMNEDQIMSLIDKINDYFTNEFLEKWLNTQVTQMTKKFTMDLVLLDTGFYFIETNSFGPEYAAGSSLFHWITDIDILCNDKNLIEFRYTGVKSIQVVKYTGP